jgi:serine/threonine protein kinase
VAEKRLYFLGDLCGEIIMKRLLKKRYEIVGVLGRGGMGCVYKVSDRSQRGRVLAAKELKPGRQSAEKAGEALAQFQTEARILMSLTHPNLPKVYDYFSRLGAYTIVMEYVRGKTLEQVLDAQRGKPMDEQRALSWALQVCRAMHFLSVQKPRPIVFRDLKPANIMIDRSGRVKLIDFGIARFFKEDKSKDTYVYGTPGYAAPEQYGTAQTDVRSDIFSLGATLHHCLTGRNPSENPLEFPDPRQLNPGLSRETAAIIRKALEPDMDKRFQNANDMKLAIQKVLLDLSMPVKGKRKVIYARPGKTIKLPWWKKTLWVSVPAMALGCSGSTGTLSSDDLWIKPKPMSFGPDAARLLFRVEGRKLKLGQEYRPHITVKTDEGTLKPQLVFKKEWPWIFVEAAVIAGVIAAAAMVRWGAGR